MPWIHAALFIYTSNSCEVLIKWGAKMSVIVNKNNKTREKKTKINKNMKEKKKKQYFNLSRLQIMLM